MQPLPEFQIIKYQEEIEQQLSQYFYLILLVLCDVY